MLSPQLSASLVRLGATLSPGAHASPRHDGLPPVVRALLEDVVWPAAGVYEGTFGSWRVWSAGFGVYARGATSVQFGAYDGGNYALRADWSEGAIDDPIVFGLDHGGGGERRLGALAAFFAGLSPVPAKRVSGRLGAELLDAVSSGGADVVARVGQLLDDGADANATNERGLTPLHAATRSAELRDRDVLPLIARLLTAGADPRPALPADVHSGRVQGEAGMTALHFVAVKAGRADDLRECARLLLAAGADPDARSASGTTPLHLATANGEVDVTRALLAAGADPNAPTTIERFAVLPGTTPLHDAVRRLAHVEALLASPRIAVDAVDAGRLTPLHRAVITNTAPVVAALLRAGADATIALTTPRRVSHVLTHAYVMLPAGSTPAQTAALVGAAAAAATLAAAGTGSGVSRPGDP